jgi:hypothetical protein
MLKSGHQTPTRLSWSRRSATDNKPRESHVQKASVAGWLDNGGQLLQPRLLSAASRCKSLVPMRWAGGGRAWYCAPQAHGCHDLKLQRRRDEEVGGGGFCLPVQGTTGLDHVGAAFYR